MCSTGDVRSLRVRNVTFEPLGDHVDVFDVLVAGYDECRDGDISEPLRGRGIEPSRPQVVMTLRLLEGMTLHLDGQLAKLHQESDAEFAYQHPGGRRPLLELAPVPSWHELQFRG